MPARRWRARHIAKTEDERRRNMADRRVEVAPADDDLCWLPALLPADVMCECRKHLTASGATSRGTDRGLG